MKHVCTCIRVHEWPHTTVCKHVHLVKMTTTDTVSDSTPQEASNLQYFSNLLEDGVEDSPLSTLRQQVLSKLDEMAIHVRGSQNRDALKTSLKHLTSALMAIKAMESMSESHSILPQKRKFPPNKKSEKHPRFFSTKKQQLRISLRMDKPSNKEVYETKQSLFTQNTTCCGICFQEDDNSSNTFINWVQCCKCEIWLHVKCATGDDNAYLHDYTCDLCSTTDRPSHII